jgi:uncharacterized protein (TIGR02001 family)
MTKITRFAFTAVFTLLSAIPALAQEPIFTTGCNLKFTSAYVLDIGAKPSDSPAVQGSCRFIHKSGFYAGAWAGQLTNTPGRETLGNEVDWYVGGSKTFKGGLTVDLSAWFYDLANPTVFDGSAGDYMDYQANFSWCAKCRVRPFIEGHLMRGTGRLSFPDGWYGKIGGDTNLRDNLTIGGNFVHGEGINGPPLDVLRLTLTPAWKVGSVAFTTPVSYSRPLRGEGLEEQVWGSINFNF